MKSLTATADLLFAALIHARGRCERCGSEGNNDTAHILGRSHYATRWLPDGALNMCRTCHRWGHDHPSLFIAWINATWPGRHQRLHEVISRTGKVDIALVLKELRRLLRESNIPEPIGYAS